MTTEFTWTCAQCGRSVPRRVEQCRCGAARVSAEAQPEEPVAAPVPGPSATPSSGPHPVLVASSVVGVAVIGAAVILALSWERAPQAPLQSSQPAEAVAGSPSITEAPDEDLEVPGLIDLMAAPEASTPSDDRPAMLSFEEVIVQTMPAVAQVETPEGTGSAFFVARDTLLTNAHVVGDRKAVNLRLAGGQRRSAGVEQVWRETDLAVLKIDIVDLDQVVLALARPEDVRLGAEVVAIGSPLGLQNTVTRGIISAKREYVYDRIGRQSVNVVQTDAAINPGNSGGPLIDRTGRVVGVNTMKIGGRAEGLGFAVDMFYARRMLGADFALKSAADQRREDGLRRYEQSVRILAMRADETEGRWMQNRGTCFNRSTQERAAVREWFVLAGDAPGLLRDTPACQNLNPFFTSYAKRIREALQQYEESAVDAGVAPEKLRLVRRRYNLAWPGWEGAGN